MKSKNQRKRNILTSPDHSRSKSSIKIHFNLSTQNLSCFFSQKNTSNVSQKQTEKSSSKTQNRLQSYQSKREVQIIPKQDIKTNSRKQKQYSPDLPRNLSNIIIQQIQKEGINCQWMQQGTSLKGKDQIYQIQNDEIWTVFSNQCNQSFASTTDLQYHNFSYSNNHFQMIQKQHVNRLSFGIQIKKIGIDGRTTIMIRNIPNKYSITQLSQQIDNTHANTYDFLYLPSDFNNECNVGYGFINFISTDYLKSFYDKFENYIWKKYKSGKICSLKYGRLQGLGELIEHFENSKVLNVKEKKYRPIIKYDKIYELVKNQKLHQVQQLQQ